MPPPTAPRDHLVRALHAERAEQEKQAAAAAGPAMGAKKTAAKKAAGAAKKGRGARAKGTGTLPGFADDEGEGA